MLSGPPCLRASAMSRAAASCGVGAAERLADGRGRHGAAEAVAAEQQHVAAAQVDLELVDAHLRLGAQRAAEDAAVRVDGRLLFGEAPVAHHLADQRVVVAELLQLAVAQQVGAAVADVHEVAGVALERDGGERGAHARGRCRSRARAKTAALAASAAASSGRPAATPAASVSAARALATSPACAPPMPSQTANSGGGHDEGVLVGLAVQADVAEGTGAGRRESPARHSS